jgi:hypothetical protein
MIAPDERGGKSLARPKTTAEFARFRASTAGVRHF